MKPLTSLITHFFETTSHHAAAPWPVHRGSLRVAPAAPVIPRRDAYNWYRDARRFNQQTKKTSSTPPALGSAALRVFEALVFDFLNYRTGRLDPSYDRIAEITGLARSTVALALQKLSTLRIITWFRRCEGGTTDQGWRLRQITNSYRLLPPASWLGRRESPQTPPDPHPSATGSHPPLPDRLTAAADAVRKAKPICETLAILREDPDDILAIALSTLGDNILKSENRTETSPRLEDDRCRAPPGRSFSR